MTKPLEQFSKLLANPLTLGIGAAGFTVPWIASYARLLEPFGIEHAAIWANLFSVATVIACYHLRHFFGPQLRTWIVWTYVAALLSALVFLLVYHLFSVEVRPGFRITTGFWPTEEGREILEKYRTTKDAMFAVSIERLDLIWPKWTLDLVRYGIFLLYLLFFILLVSLASFHAIGLLKPSGPPQELDVEPAEEGDSGPDPVADRTSDYHYDIFISYSSADKQWVKDTLLPRLEAAGLRTLIDYRDFEIGLPSSINIERAVDNSRHTLVVLTPDWVKSGWTELESLLVGTIDPAARRRKLIPLRLKPCQPPRRIAMLTYADFTDPKHQPRELARLVEQLQKASRQPAPADSEAEATPAPPANALRRRPAQGGDSVSHDRGGAATLGCLVTDRGNPKKIYILSDFNGLGNPHATSRAGDPILQPGRTDGSNRDRDVIATLARWTTVRNDPQAVADNLSAAIAEVLRIDDVSPELRGRGLLRGAATAHEGQAVALVGRTGGLVHGTVLRVGVQQEVPCSRFQIEGPFSGGESDADFHPILFVELIECTHMLEPGDCGAILVDEQNYALGLGFAGNQEVSLFVPFQKVLDALKVDLLTKPAASQETTEQSKQD